MKKLLIVLPLFVFTNASVAGDSFHEILEFGANQEIDRFVSKIHKYSARQLNRKDDRGRTLLHIAVRTKNNKAVKALVHEGVHLNAQDESGNTPLHIAARFDLSDTANILFDAGADASVKNKKDQYTPFHEATFWGSSNVAGIFLKSGKFFTEKDAYEHTPIFNAIYGNYIPIAQNILKKATEMGVKDSVLNTKDRRQFTPLHWATYLNRTEMVVLLVNAKSKLNETDGFGLTPLHYATLARNYKNIEKLVNAGAKVNVQDAFGKAPLHYLYTSNKTLKNLKLSADSPIREDSDLSIYGENSVSSYKIIKFFFCRGADFKVKDNHGMTFRDYIAENHDFGTVSAIHPLYNMNIISNFSWKNRECRNLDTD